MSFEGEVVAFVKLVPSGDVYILSVLPAVTGPFTTHNLPFHAAEFTLIIVFVGFVKVIRSIVVATNGDPSPPIKKYEPLNTIHFIAPGIEPPVGVI
jgi:hypothetical protein